MVRKICFSILSVVILITGVIAFSKLTYWNRSIRIFSFSSNAPFEGRMGKGPEGRGELGERYRSDRPDFRNLPDSIRARFEAREGHPRQGSMNRNMPDSLRHKIQEGDRNQMEPGSFRGGMRKGEGHGRGEFPGGKKINLGNVLWFLAVFASFTVVAIYADKVISLIRRRKAWQ